MTTELQKFIENNIDVIGQQDWKKLFNLGYRESLMTTSMQELSNLLKDVFHYDSTQLRNDLLFDRIDKNLNYVRSQYPPDQDQDELRVIDSYVVQFLRHYLNNNFGFLEGEVVQFMYDNQDALGISLTSTNRAPGQGGYNNYRITYK